MEARNYLMANLPGAGEDNVYYWYYATLACFIAGCLAAWNIAMKSRLIGTQRPAYDSDAGSWDPDRLWGGYGGRVSRPPCHVLPGSLLPLPATLQGNSSLIPQASSSSLIPHTTFSSLVMRPVLTLSAT